MHTVILQLRANEANVSAAAYPDDDDPNAKPDRSDSDDWSTVEAALSVIRDKYVDSSETGNNNE